MPRYRKLTDQENTQPRSFSDHFRFQHDARLDRDDAKDLRDAIEALIAEKTGNNQPHVTLLVSAHK